jgi:hypothetical protein
VVAAAVTGPLISLVMVNDANTNGGTTGIVGFVMPVVVEDDIDCDAPNDGENAELDANVKENPDDEVV